MAMTSPKAMPCRPAIASPPNSRISVSAVSRSPVLSTLMSYTSAIPRMRPQNESRCANTLRQSAFKLALARRGPSRCCRFFLSRLIGRYSLEFHLSFRRVDPNHVARENLALQDLLSQRILHQPLHCAPQGPRAVCRIVAFGEY